MSRAKNVIDMRASKGFSSSQGNEHLRRLDDCKRAQKPDGIMTLQENS